jgi:FKBP-type peptidyl-prolyl cis-trans isomerase SlyD
MIQKAMTVAKDRVVTFSYTLISGERKFLDDSTLEAPVSYLHGHGQLFPALEQALEGRQAEDSVRVEISADRGYGQRDEALLLRVPKKDIEGVDRFEVGMQLEALSEQGNHIVTVRQVDTDAIVVDGNHPLAGMDLVYFATIKKVRDATPEELAHGHVHEGHHHHHHHDEEDAGEEG